MPKCSAVSAPTWPVSPSVVFSPHNIRSNSPSFFMALESAYEVARVSEPASFLSESKIALSAPLARASLRASFASGGPIHTAVTLPPTFSLIFTASSRAFRSKGLIS
jgi:hypothetical protein